MQPLSENKRSPYHQIILSRRREYSEPALTVLRTGWEVKRDRHELGKASKFTMITLRYLFNENGELFYACNMHRKNPHPNLIQYSVLSFHLLSTQYQNKKPTYVTSLSDNQ